MRKCQSDLIDILRSRRTELGLSQKDVAEKIGMSLRAYSRYETGETIPSTPERIRDIEDALGISLRISEEAKEPKSTPTVNPKDVRGILAAAGYVITSHDDFFTAEYDGDTWVIGRYQNSNV